MILQSLIIALQIIGVVAALGFILGYASAAGREIHRIRKDRKDKDE